MPYKNEKQQKECQAKYYQDNKNKYRLKGHERKKILKNWYLEIKSQYACLQCGEQHPACLTFHHRDPLLKAKNVSRMVMRGSSKEVILNEIKKCDVLCANCHLKLHRKMDDTGRYDLDI